MDYKEKYELALERAKALYGQPLVDNTLLETILPELKESEDERIRKALIRFFQRFPYDRLNYENLKSEEAITWLEKQAERKTPQWMIDFLDNCRRKIGCSLDYDEARDVDGKILCIKEWLEKQGK